MDYFQGVVADYLSADPAVFVQPEACIRLHDDRALKKGEHWYCDILAVSFRERSVYLCEVTLSRDLGALEKRLKEWDANWSGVREALTRDGCIDGEWRVRPWAFVPAAQKELLSRKVTRLRDRASGPHEMPRPLATSLEDVVPWRWSWPLSLPDAKVTSQA